MTVPSAAPRERPKAPTAIGQQLIDQYGNKQGLVDGALPVVTFVVLNLLVGARPGALVGALVAVAIIGFRLSRRQSVQQAVGGFVGLAIGFVITLFTGKASNVYLPGILITFAYALVPLLSILLRRPFAGYVAALMETRWATWREIPELRRAATQATGVWVLGYGLKGAVQGTFYLLDLPTALGVGKLVLGYPLYGAIVVCAIAIMKRATAAVDPLLLPEPAED